MTIVKCVFSEICKAPSSCDHQHPHDPSHLGEDDCSSASCLVKGKHIYKKKELDLYGKCLALAELPEINTLTGAIGIYGITKEKDADRENTILIVPSQKTAGSSFSLADPLTGEEDSIDPIDRRRQARIIATEWRSSTEAPPTNEEALVYYQDEAPSISFIEPYV